MGRGSGAKRLSAGSYGGGGENVKSGASVFSKELVGANDVKVTGEEINNENLKYFPGSYEILYNNGNNITIKRQNGYLVKQSNRLFGFTDTPGEDGYTITDIKTGLIIGKTHPKTIPISIGHSVTHSGKSGFAVKDELLLFTDKLSHANNKAAIKNAEKQFETIKSGG